MIGIIQLNPTVGDVDSNCNKIIRAIKGLKASIIITPELATTGYPPSDLLLNNEFVRAVIKGNKRIARASKTSLILGTVTLNADKLYNSALFCRRGKIIGCYNKRILKTKPYFDGQRYFQPGDGSGLIKVGRKGFGVIFYDEIEKITSSQNADCYVVLGAQPYCIDIDREKILSRLSKKINKDLLYVNLVGGQEQLVFDGGSLLITEQGKIRFRSPKFVETAEAIKLGRVKTLTKDEDLLHALIIGIRDYAEKNNFRKVIIGISGGIDSALTITLATLALGPENVIGIIMPGPFSSDNSTKNALTLARNLRVKTVTINIEPIYASYLFSLRDIFKHTKFGIAEENIQARIRGNLLMAISNKFGYLVLSTGNRSEAAMGYATLYGDLAGGFSPISDLYKREVYRLSRYINKKFKRQIIPRLIIRQAPSAELRPDHRDEDDLPPYGLLDPILEQLINSNFDYTATIKKGFDKRIVTRILHMIQRSEFKRRQAPIGIKVHKKAFGLGIKMPATMRWK